MPNDVPADPEQGPAAEQPADAPPAATPRPAAEPAGAAPTTAEAPAEQTAAEADEPPVPSEAELERTAQPATVRRAPKYSAFMTAGGILGFVLALVLIQVFWPKDPRPADGSGFLPFLDGVNAVRTVLGVGLAVLGIFVGGLVAVVIDRRSGRGTPPTPR